MATKKAVYIANLELKGVCFTVKLRVVGICFILHLLAFLESILPCKMKITPYNTIVMLDYIMMNVLCTTTYVLSVLFCLFPVCSVSSCPFSLALGWSCWSNRL